MALLTGSTVKKILRFGWSSGIATLLHWGTMYVLVQAGITPLFATAAGALVGAACNYLLQFHVTFEGRSSHKQAVPVFVLVALLSWLSNNGLFEVCYQWLQWSVPVSQVVTTLMVALLNFVLYSRIVFREHQSLG